MSPIWSRRDGASRKDYLSDLARRVVRVFSRSDAVPMPHGALAQALIRKEASDQEEELNDNLRVDRWQHWFIHDTERQLE